MTIITEYRWKCDYCGNVSPRLLDETAVTSPPGWVKYHTPTSPPSVLYFCQHAHYEAWLAEREKESAA